MVRKMMTIFGPISGRNAIRNPNARLYIITYILNESNCRPFSAYCIKCRGTEITRKHTHIRGNSKTVILSRSWVPRGELVKKWIWLIAVCECKWNTSTMWTNSSRKWITKTSLSHLKPKLFLVVAFQERHALGFFRPLWVTFSNMSCCM